MMMIRAKEEGVSLSPPRLKKDVLISDVGRLVPNVPRMESSTHRHNNVDTVLFDFFQPSRILFGK
jgi:hypothetical protein